MYSLKKMAPMISNFFWLSWDQVVRLAVGLFVTTWVARYLGVDGFGKLSFAIAFATLLGGFARLGLEQVLTREIVRTPDRTGVLLGSAFFARMVSGFFAFALLVAVSFVYSSGFDNKLILIVAATSLFQPLLVTASWFQSKILSKYYVYSLLSAFLIHAGIRVVLILSGVSVVWFAYAFLLESALSGVFALIVYSFKSRALHTWKVSLKQIGSLLKDSWPQILAFLSVTIYMRVDQIMIGSMLGEREVGLYTAALRLSEVWFVVPMALTSTFLPMLVKSKEKTREEYHRRFQLFMDINGMLAYVIAIPVILMSHYMVWVLFGAEYMESVAILRVYVLSCLFVFVGVPSSAYLMNENLLIYTFWSTFFGAVTNLLLNLYLIPEHGPMGAAVATVVSQSIACLFSKFLFTSTREIAAMIVSSLFSPIRVVSIYKQLHVYLSHKNA